MQLHKEDNSTPIKVRDLISDLENDLHQYERLAELRMIPEQELESIRKSILQSIADLRGIRFANGEN